MAGRSNNSSWSEMIAEMFGGYTELRNAMGPEPGLDAKTSPAKTTRSRTEIESGNEALGVCAKACKTNARFPLTRPTSLEMCYQNDQVLQRGSSDSAFS